MERCSGPHSPDRLTQRVDMRCRPVGMPVKQVHGTEERSPRDPIAAIVRHETSMPGLVDRRNALPLFRPTPALCTSAPSSSAVTISPVAARTNGGPPKKIVPSSLTMIDSSDIGAARGARSHDQRHLRHPSRRQPRLVVKDAAEMVAVGKHLVLRRQKRPA
jgi:hypothetical protein